MHYTPKPAAANAREPLRIVSIGGGTGLSTLLQGLKRYVRQPGCDVNALGSAWPCVDITAIVTVTDDGGSSGRLRRDFDVLPPGDIRNCMVALSGDEALLARLFQYRFASGRGLKGHSFGNLFLTALTHLTGDFAQAVKLSSEVLSSAGRIYPSTSANVSLQAKLESGKTVVGESKISKSRSKIESVALVPPRCMPLEDTLQAIRVADLITLGPGSLFTSVIPNLLVEGIPEAIRKSKAAKAYFVNLMWQPGETMGFTAADHIKAMARHAGRNVVDCIVVNTQPIGPKLRARYAAQRVYPVIVDRPELELIGVRPVGYNLLAKSEKVRHDPISAAHAAVTLALEARERKEGTR